MEPSKGFAPVVAAGARVLILGSLPGQRSLAADEYYAHPQNAFWPIMKEIYGFGGDYASRCRSLTQHRIALWDVLQASVRPGSLDADIRQATAVVNDFQGFLARYPDIHTILFNGKKSEQMFIKRVPREHHQNQHLAGLPSTSPAFAAMPFSGKLAVWRTELASRLP
jgi:TDG/mug DNA glycosylase family protein